MKANSRIVFNTGVLYVKMLVTMAFTLLSTRWILSALGTDDFGLFNLIAGLVAMLSFLNTAMAVGTQRNLSFQLGKKDFDALKETFSCSAVIHALLGLVVVVFCESIGRFFLEGSLNIPVSRTGDALLLLHIMTASMFFTIVSVPFLAAINSHEHMIVIAAVNIFEALWKFSFALYLMTYGGDRLILYAILILVMTFLSFMTMMTYCLKKYPETRLWERCRLPMTRIKFLLSYSSWNVIGAFGLLLKGQGIALLFNSFAGVAVNAAYGVAQQVNGQMSFFSNSIIRAFNPQIISSEGESNHERMLYLSCMSCKVSTMLMLVVVVPLMFNLKFILNLWLKNVPDHAIVFTFLILINSVFFQMYHGLELAVHADGRIRNFSLVACAFNLMAVPLGYIFLRIGLPLETVIVGSILCGWGNMYNVAYHVQKYCGLKKTFFYKTIVLPMTALFLIASSLCFVIVDGNSGWVRLIICYLLNTTSVLLLFFLIVLSRDERGVVFSLVLNNKLVKKCFRRA